MPSGELQAQINELCRQTWHLDEVRLAALAPVWGADGRRTMTDYEATLAIEALTRLRDGETADGVRSWLAAMLK